MKLESDQVTEREVFLCNDTPITMEWGEIRRTLSPIAQRIYKTYRLDKATGILSTICKDKTWIDYRIKEARDELLTLW